MRIGDQLFAFATSAVRDASNGVEIADRLARETGIQPRFLTGEEEARLTYLAVRRWYGWSAGRLLVLDIGGGSMEIALGRDAQPEFAVSLPLGVGSPGRSCTTTRPSVASSASSGITPAPRFARCPTGSAGKATRNG